MSESINSVICANTPAYRTGDHVVHEMFGEGQIVDIDCDPNLPAKYWLIYRVYFSGVGIISCTKHEIFESIIPKESA